MDNIKRISENKKIGLTAALLELEHNKKMLESEKEYYDGEKDQRIISNYYDQIHFNEASKEKLFKQLNQLVVSTHINWLPYNSKTRNYLYSLVDLQADGNLKSIYSGKEKDPEQVMKEDDESERKREQAYNELLKSNLVNNDNIQEIMASLESENMYNCEHVVPQSWFGKRNPMKGDLHHLFTCEKECNSLRSNHPYYDFADYSPKMETEVIKTQCGKYEEAKFEPESGKGEVARATLYFLLRYPGEVSQYSNQDIELLLKWHNDYKVSIYEKHRNKAIFDIQKNRNPLIDFPQYADKIDFMLGLSK
ncbi:endonuclease I family protein [Pseudobacillus wudalianchiensis]|uniref:Endonuclease I n=1 Tax=Pseudobacillus wudalianchiensis TaxID=1743143 RepID=A0A1B9AE90_9BACI|nr:endonuclease [Bacillus wudalianchiensis]OCA82144.1 endonuclease I [Bacillus wudalianchiensis]